MEENRQILTTARLFPDGAAIELVRGGKLLLRQAGCETVDSMIDFNGCIYRAPKLDVSLEAALNLPAGTANFDTTEALVSRITQDLQKLNLDPPTCLDFASIGLATWVAECLAGAVVVNVWGTPESQASALPYLRALCRRPLVLHQPSLGHLAQFHESLRPTLFIRVRKADAHLERLLAVADEDGAGLLHRGALRRAQVSALIILSPEPLDVAVNIPLPVGMPLVTTRDIADVIDEFSPALLAYRLSQHLAIAASKFEVAGFSPGLGVAARALGAAVEGSPELQTRIVAALAIIDEELKSASSQTLDGIALEAVLAACHERHPQISLGEICRLGNAIAIGRGDRPLLEPKGLGGILTKAKIRRKRAAGGFEVVFDGATCMQVHEQNRALGAPSLMHPFGDCTYCGRVFAATTPDR